jgi:large subunit ribosomal protein L21
LLRTWARRSRSRGAGRRRGADLKVGHALVSGATVTATVVAHGRHDKVRIFKMRRRKHYQKRQGHRQNFTELQIGSVNA